MTRDFRADARAARAEAQARLRALREARRHAGRHAGAAAPRPAPIEPNDGPETTPQPPVLRVSSAAEDLSRLARAEDAAEPVPAGRGAEPATPAPQAPSRDTPVGPGLPDDGGPGEPPIDGAADAGPTPAPTAGPDPAPPAGGPDAGTPHNPPDRTDLADLPGIGPGLIHLLARAGVRSRAELAASDAETLRPALGLAGQFLDLDAWIAAAATRD